MAENIGIESGYPDGREFFAGFGDGYDGFDGMPAPQVQAAPQRQATQMPQVPQAQQPQGQMTQPRQGYARQAQPQGQQAYGIQAQGGQQYRQPPQGQMPPQRQAPQGQRWPQQPQAQAPQGQVPQPQRQGYGTQAQAYNVQAQGGPQAYQQASTPQGAQAQTRNDDDYSSPETMLKSGAILQAYGSKDMLSVNPVPNIHMVRWSIVRLGTGGKDSADFFMKMDDMRRLCEEIDNGIAAGKFNADNRSDYPEAYQFVGGKDGCKKVGIGKGRRGLCVQVQVKEADGKMNRKIAPLPSYDVLKDMSFYFRLVMGLIPASQYYGRLVDAYWAELARRDEAHKKGNR